MDKLISPGDIQEDDEHLYSFTQVLNQHLVFPRRSFLSRGFFVHHLQQLVTIQKKFFRNFCDRKYEYIVLEITSNNSIDLRLYINYCVIINNKIIIIDR